MIAVTYHAGVNEVQGDNALVALMSAPSALAPFDRLDWYALLQQHCDLKPLFVMASDGDARAVLVLNDDHGHLRPCANWYTFRWQPHISPGADAHALMLAIAADLKTRAFRLTLSPLPGEEGDGLALLAHAFRQAGWRVRTAECDVNHVLPVNGRSFTEFLSGRPGALRTTLKRKSGKVAVELASHFDPALWAEYEAVYAASWKPSEGSPAFLRAFAEAEGAAGRLRMAIARADGAAVAAQFWTVEAGTAFIHKLAHTEAAKPLSPGTTLSAALFEQVIDRDRVILVDFGTGDDPYKRDWMEMVRPRYRLECLNPASPRAWPHMAHGALRRIAGRG